MCLGFPGRVTAVDQAGATIDTEGRLRRASTLLMPDIAIGDWVFVAAGTVIDRLEPDEAAHIRETLLEAIALDAADQPGQ
jgi:hydrogenase assembly chaperone HypC/HupF